MNHKNLNYLIFQRDRWALPLDLFAVLDQRLTQPVPGTSKPQCLSSSTLLLRPHNVVRQYHDKPLKYNDL